MPFFVLKVYSFSKLVFWQISIYGLYASDLNISFYIEKPIHVVAIDPSFAKTGSGRRFVCGDDKVINFITY